MPESKHTAGELKLVDMRGVFNLCTSTGNPLIEFKAASVEGGVRYNELCRLFASAPDLLSALEEITEHAYDDDTNWDDLAADFDAMRDIARAAIQKARGGE